MFRSGMALTIVGLAVAATGLLAIRSVSVPLPGSWHMTFFLPGIGTLVCVAGVAVIAWSRLRTRD